MEKVITDGAVPVESWLENEGALAARLKTSRATTRRALEELVRRGLVIRYQGRGTQVVSTIALRRPAIMGLFDELRAARRIATTRVMTMSLKNGVPEIKRVRYADGAPLAVLRNKVPALSQLPLRSQLEDGGLYQLLRLQNVTFRSVQQRLQGRPATAEEASLLHLGERDFVIAAHTVASDPAGKIIEYGDHTFRPDAYTFETTCSDM